MLRAFGGGGRSREMGMDHVVAANFTGESSLSSAAAAAETDMIKAEIAVHPLFEQLIAAHVGCLRVATPNDQLPIIEAQLVQSHSLLRSYAARHRPFLGPTEKQELDSFLTQYLLVLGSFRDQLQHHVRMHAMEAVMACRQMENTLQELTGARIEEVTGATMSDDEDNHHHQMDLRTAAAVDVVGTETAAGDIDMTGFGPLMPTDSERSLMERVRQELKHELKQGFKSRIEDVREEILRKRRAGKLPGDTTTVLKQWWQQHSKWPYPTEDDKAKLVEETGLQLKQINNWFINQRKRNWHNTSHSSLKSKRKR